LQQNDFPQSALPPSSLYELTPRRIISERGVVITSAHAIEGLAELGETGKELKLMERAVGIVRLECGAGLVFFPFFEARIDAETSSEAFEVGAPAS
jgi:hypothetical protein